MTGPGERARYDAVERAVRLARYGADGYAYCLLAAGHIDLIVEAGLEPYDVVGLVPIIEAAGGIVTTWTGASANNGGTDYRRRRPAHSCVGPEPAARREPR
jgi:fructose-1,6-bisphosphatase/inositol monophosphatase family enzyme